ncbi:DUF453-domain-containing protein [Thozetella sp. PMI_491]|nr:DUF453-domain-containing protein [Thozetella sp. PMI_491]
MLRRCFPAIFARGGTSNGLVIQRHNLPPQDEWHTVLPSAMGSPDGFGRQLNGMGSGVSSTSKICVLSPSSRRDADVEFTFVQVGIKDGTLDLAGNCGNMSSVVGPIGLNEGLVKNLIIDTERGSGCQTALVRIFNTNTSKLIHSRFRVAGSPPQFCPDGDYEMDGVPGKGSRITLSFLNPAGAKTGRALPTGKPVDALTLPDGSCVKVSLVDVSNPGVFVRTADLGIASDDHRLLDPTRLEADPVLMARLEQIRQAGAIKMGLDPLTESVPKIVLIFDSPDRPDTNIKCLALSMGQAHKAVPLTLALCLGAAVKLPGTIPNRLAVGDVDGEAIVIGHPSGTVDIGTTVKNGEIQSAELHRTARLLMKGDVFY